MLIDNFTKENIKGIDVLIRALKKKYKFITDYRITPDPENKYKFTIFIELFINFEKLSEYSGYELSDFYYKKKNTIDNKSFISTYFNTKGEFSSGSLEELVNYFSNLKEDINKDMEQLYEDGIPKEFKVRINDYGYSFIELFMQVTLDGFSDDSLIKTI